MVELASASAPARKATIRPNRSPVGTLDNPDDATAGRGLSGTRGSVECPARPKPENEVDLHEREACNMPKMKSHKGLRKRFRVSAKGKLKYKRANAGHLMSGKSGARRRKLRAARVLRAINAKRMLVMIEA